MATLEFLPPSNHISTGGWVYEWSPWAYLNDTNPRYIEWKNQEKNVGIPENGISK